MEKLLNLKPAIFDRAIYYMDMEIKNRKIHVTFRSTSTEQKMSREENKYYQVPDVLWLYDEFEVLVKL